MSIGDHRAWINAEHNTVGARQPAIKSGLMTAMSGLWDWDRNSYLSIIVWPSGFLVGFLGWDVKKSMLKNQGASLQGASPPARIMG